MTLTIRKMEKYEYFDFGGFDTRVSKNTFEIYDIKLCYWVLISRNEKYINKIKKSKKNDLRLKKLQRILENE